MMQNKNRRSRNKVNIKISADNCVFCKARTVPSYAKGEELLKYVTDRGKILGRTRTGTCAKHQRLLGIEIKRARHLGLLPFTAAL